MTKEPYPTAQVLDPEAKDILRQVEESGKRDGRSAVPEPLTGQDAYAKANSCHNASDGRFCSTGRSASRAQRARETFKPATREKQKIADRSEAHLAEVLRADRTPNNSPFDLIKGKHGIEVKTLIDQKNSKITCHPESCARKRSAARKLKVRPHTIAIDLRGGTAEYYYARGVGSFRLGGMKKVTLSELQEIFK
jgi:hypothetical protein